MLAKQVLVISLIIPFIEYYCFAAIRTVSRNWTPNRRLTVWILYFLLSVATLWALFSFRSWATSVWPSHFIRHVVNTLLGVFLGKLLISMLMLGGDILILIRRLLEFVFSLPDRLRKEKPQDTKRITRSQFIAAGALMIGGLFTSALGYGMTNKYRYKVRRTKIEIPNLPERLRGLRILQISDIHSGSFDNPEAVENGVEMAMREQPDLVLFTGDLVNYRADEMKIYRQIFRKLKAPLGVYSVLGNHDYGDYLSWPNESDKKDDFEKLKQYHHSMDWNLLLNEHVILNWKDQDFALIGVENWSSHARFPRYGKLDLAMNGLDNSLPLKILMSHDPSHWDAQVRPGYPGINLTLSGHTHGFQMGIEIPGFRWSPVQYLYKQWAGLYREGNQYLYVNRGFGFIGYDGRLGILPEIALLELI
jgi:predicted MPP superfamily phosphohydrolase